MAAVNPAYIVDAVRAPIGRKNGTLSVLRGDDLAAQVLNALVARNDVDAARGRGRADGLRHADRRAGLEHRADGGHGRRLAGRGVRHDGRPAVRLVDADELQRGGGGHGRSARRGRLGGRGDDVARSDGLERRRSLRAGDRPLPDRAAGHLGRVDLAGMGSVARAARRVFAGVAPARDRGVRRGPFRARDRSGRIAGRRALRRRRGCAARHVGREARRAQAGVHPGRRGHGGELVADRRRRSCRADRERGCVFAARAQAARAVRFVRARRRRPDADAARQPAGDRQGAREGGARRSTTWR